jgi:hypothetical protein
MATFEQDIRQHLNEIAVTETTKHKVIGKGDNAVGVLSIPNKGTPERAQMDAGVKRLNDWHADMTKKAGKEGYYVLSNHDLVGKHTNITTHAQHAFSRSSHKHLGTLKD